MALGIDWNEPWGCSPLPSRAGKRQGATEPTIGNREWDPRLICSFLSVNSGDRINAMMSSVGSNFCKLLKTFSLPFVFQPQSVPENRRAKKMGIPQVTIINTYQDGMTTSQPKYGWDGFSGTTNYGFACDNGWDQ